MQVNVTFRHMDSSEPLRKYAVEKTARLSKYLFEPIDVHWVLSVEKIRHIADSTINANGVSIKAQEATQDMYSAIDLVLEKLEKQVRKHKEKIKGHKARVNAGEAAAEAASMEAEGAEGAGGAGGAAGSGKRPRIVKKVNQFVKPMSVEEAAMQMDLVGSSFLVFTDSSTGNINVIYRTEDGDYGLIEARTR